MIARHILRGRSSETGGRRWLERQGLRSLSQNYRCPCGELDLLMLDGDCLVVVEVRYRAADSYGGALESITKDKRDRIRRATEHFLQQHPQHRERPVRFDVLAMTGTGRQPRFDWRRAAFDCSAG
jgi:putative endonuclease